MFEATYNRKKTHEGVEGQQAEDSVKRKQTPHGVDRENGKQDIGTTIGPETVATVGGLVVVVRNAHPGIPPVGTRIITSGGLGSFHGFGFLDVGHGERLDMLFAKRSR